MIVSRRFEFRLLYVLESAVTEVKKKKPLKERIAEKEAKRKAELEEKRKKV